MKRLAWIGSLALLVLAGCPSSDKEPSPQPLANEMGSKPIEQPVEPPAAPAPSKSRPAPIQSTGRQADETVAIVNGNAITRSQLDQPLIEGYGLNVLLNIAQLEIAKQQAKQSNVHVSPQDIDAEREQMMKTMFKDADKNDYPQLLDQLLQNQRISRPEFEIVVQTNAYLRKIAEPLLKDKVTDDQLQEAYRAVYGETVQVRHIQCANLQEIGEAKRRLAAGEPFEKVAMALSRNQRTVALGGELPPFSRYATGYPQAFKDAAFALKKGEVSDAVSAEGAIHLIKLEERIAPKAVKFEDVKESVREDLYDRFLQATVKDLRVQIAQQTRERLSIVEPGLKKQYENKMTEADKQIKEKAEISKRLDQERQQRIADLNAAATQPATSTQTTGAPTTTSPENLRPPATTPEQASGATATQPSKP